MRIKHRYAFNCGKDPKYITNFLNKYGIKYELTQPITIIIFEIYEDQEYSADVKEFMYNHGQKPWSEIVYSKKELDDASWLTIRAKWRSEYPQPEDDYEYKRITYNTQHYCGQCGCGLIQQNNFRLKKTPSWGKRNFLMPNWLHDELFITNAVAQKLNESDLRGFLIRNVDHYRTGEPLSNTNQIHVENYLQKGMIFGEGDIAQRIECTKCGFVKLIRTGTSLIRFPEYAFESVSTDIVKTSEKFGDGFECMSIIIINGKFYNLLKENNWDKDLYVQPVYVTK